MKFNSTSLPLVLVPLLLAIIAAVVSAVDPVAVICSLNRWKSSGSGFTAKYDPALNIVAQIHAAQLSSLRNTPTSGMVSSASVTLSQNLQRLYPAAAAGNGVAHSGVGFVRIYDGWDALDYNGWNGGDPSQAELVGSFNAAGAAVAGVGSSQIVVVVVVSLTNSVYLNTLQAPACSAVAPAPPLTMVVGAPMSG
ncbi:hypothetical protein GQ42DRAFT_162112 [Ramicandelaber brevisporus]|nr:hypothetical protein GQ42DRAFT_162112 [Ramicandelaber brevisporus]